MRRAIVTAFYVAAAAHAAVNLPVTWLKDPAWFADEARKGPCPAAAVLYSERYARVQNRTCRDRLDAIQPLRARLRGGGFDWSSLPDFGGDVTIVGDSLAEQHFAALVCYAWSAGMPVDGPSRLSQRGNFPDWHAVLNDGALHALRLRFVRQDQLPNPNTLDGAVYAAPPVLVIGGWHHGHAQLAKYIRAIAQLRGANRTLVVEALPGHFPGGAYRGAAGGGGSRPGGYPRAKAALRNASCDDVANRSGGEPRVNELIAKTIDTLVPENSGMRVLRVEALYRGRGDAHVGPIPATVELGFQGRDCLHWCVAPGVLDAFALLTLHELAAVTV